MHPTNNCVLFLEIFLSVFFQNDHFCDNVYTVFYFDDAVHNVTCVTLGNIYRKGVVDCYFEFLLYERKNMSYVAVSMVGYRLIITGFFLKELFLQQSLWMYDGSNHLGLQK